VTRESVNGLPLHPDVEVDRLSLHVHGDLGPSSLDGPTDTSLGLVSYEEEPVLGVVCPLPEVLHDGASGHHTAGGEDDAGVGGMADLLPHGGGLHPLEHMGQEGVLVLLEDLGPELAVEILGVCGVDGGGLPDHSVQVDGALGDLLVAHELLDDQHDLL